MTKRKIVETTEEYNDDGKLIRKTTVETTEDDETPILWPTYPIYPTYPNAPWSILPTTYPDVTWQDLPISVTTTTYYRGSDKYETDSNDDSSEMTE